MRIEVVNTGTELLLGKVVNTHAAYFRRKAVFPGAPPATPDHDSRW